MTIWILSVLLVAPALLGRLWFLSRRPSGAVFYYSNVLNEFAVKRLGWNRHVPDLAFFCVGIAGLSATGDSLVTPLAAILLLAGLEVYSRAVERSVLTTVYCHEDRRSLKKEVRAVGEEGFIEGAFPRPCLHPDLVVNLLGPFVSRTPRYDLGDLISGRTVEIIVVIGNHSIMPTQCPVDIEVEIPQFLQCDKRGETMPAPLNPGEIRKASFSFRAEQESGTGTISITVRHADQVIRHSLMVGSVLGSDAATVKGASVSRYPGGCRSAFAWRGDMDLYDKATFQSIEGLTATLGLASRYRFPQTMFMSSRLTIDPEESAKYFDKMGVVRGQHEVGRFVEWFRENVDLRHEASYPFESEKPYLMELGNHHHLHYGTDAAAGEENCWRFQAGIGSGAYAWTTQGADSFTEQRDNALECARRFQRCFEFVPRSWTMPDSTRDEFTPKAVEAAGCEVFTDSDAGHRHNVLLQPPPHHPAGCTAAEITRRYPGDPPEFSPS